MEFKSERAVGIYKQLNNQLKSIARHNRQGSYETRSRYLEANQRFCQHLANEFGLQKFANIQDKHIESYVQDMRARGLQEKTIKTDLSAIRFFHDKVDARYTISDNSRFGFEKRQNERVDRAWNKDEYAKFRAYCEQNEKVRELATATLAREMGLRIHETTRISRSTAENALKTGYLNIKGKGGKEREVPLTQNARDVLQVNMRGVNRGQKLFVAEDEKTHLVIKQVQNFINRSRDRWQDESRYKQNELNRTFHGLRHAYAREQYEARINEGMSEYEARKEVSKLLGHERDEVTRIYLAK